MKKDQKRKTKLHKKKMRIWKLGKAKKNKKNLLKSRTKKEMRKCRMRVMLRLNNKKKRAKKTKN